MHTLRKQNAILRTEKERLKQANARISKDKELLQNELLKVQSKQEKDVQYYLMMEKEL